MERRRNQDEKRRASRLLLTALALCLSLVSIAQIPTDSLPKDPALISVFAVQNLNFGTIYQGNAGGTVSVSTAGSRSVTGDVVAITRGSAVYPAIFEVEAPAGTIVTIQNGADVPLSGSNGGSMTLRLGASYPASPFTTTVTPPSRTQVSIGGTLTVGNTAASKAGNYSGTFNIIFFQQ